ncbi:helix-turn-helix domain-containing protein [Halobacillus litoralis]|uniref:Helix-turn-helix domain-containing protein n=1 Tax=Halobacillus litoralis TaxID=45668 RepID=A0A845E3D4_9BACI|nr:helix-turn-helix transcriptional regulator [Halobacillus litoralis]MYL50287.1 helix-turn-helix domain-containing protein [Halobacillus litoralis]
MIGQRMKYLRQSKKMTQSELAEKLNITRGTYAHYEIEKRKPDYDTLQKIADFYDVSTDYLLGRTEQQTSTKNSAPFDPLQELNKIFEKYDVQDAGFWDIEKWKEMTPEDLRSLEDYFEYLYNKSKNRQHKDNKFEEVDDI